MLCNKRGTDSVDRENMCHLGGVEMGKSLLTGRERLGVVDNEIKSVCSLTEYRSGRRDARFVCKRRAARGIVVSGTASLVSKVRRSCWERGNRQISGHRVLITVAQTPAQFPGLRQ